VHEAIALIQVATMVGTRSRSAAAKARRPKTYNKPERSETDQEIFDKLIDVAADKLLHKQSENGFIPRSFMTGLVDEFKLKSPLLKDITRHTINNRVKKRRKSGLLLTPTPHLTTVSVVTTDRSNTDSSDNDSSAEELFKKKGGRPTNSTKAAKAEEEAKLAKATTWVTEQLKSKKDAAKATQTTVKRGMWKSLTLEARVKFDLSENQAINKHTVKTRLNRGRSLDGSIPSVLSPIEPLLNSLCIRCNEAGNPLDQHSFIDLVNSLIKGTELEKTLPTSRRSE
jgi:ElaB/YqjD/DUF883 family membrane-anchored ribosome-binding protein